MKYLSLIVPGSGGDVPIQTPPGVPGDAGIIGNIPVFIITILITFVIVAAVAMIIFSGIQWIASGGDAKKIEGARNRLTYAIIGLVIAVAAVVIVGTTIKLLGGDPNQFNIGNFNIPTPNQTTQQQFDNRTQHSNTDTTLPPQNCHIVTVSGKPVTVCR